MRVFAAIGLMILFAIGGVLGLALAVVIAPISLYRRARAVHADGVVCRAVVIAREPEGDRLAGPALVRLSGALAGPDAASDVLGLELRMQRTASDDARIGDQDLVLGTFESFHTIARDRARTNAGDFLANAYSTVTPWWLPGHGPVILRLSPPSADGVPAADRATDRLGRLTADLAADRARLVLTADVGNHRIELAELRLISQLTTDGHALRASMCRAGRGLRPLGLRNGIRATLYPLSQLARRLRHG
jgi:hypothetical protein